MINNSVSKAYININALSEQVEKSDIDGIPKQIEKQSKQKSKRGLLSRNKDMFKYEKVQNGRADTKS